ncbi:MAG: hypothetical protein CTY19_02715 [Methylomonas sp.]|nr:MAG: hypothetical protein CTY19_02715 [Methylomonas sp.]
MNLKLIKMLSCAVFLLFSGTSQASIFVNPGFSFTMVSISDITQAGNSIFVQIGVTGLNQSSAPSLGTYDLNLNFDPSHLSFSGAVFGDALLGNQLDLFNVGGNLSGADLTDPGTVNFYEVSLDSVTDLNDLQAESFTLATLSFDVLNFGTSDLTLSVNAFGDAEGNDLPVTTLSTSVTTVPLPSAIFMMVSGLMCLGFAGQSRKNTNGF